MLQLQSAPRGRHFDVFFNPDIGQRNINCDPARFGLRRDDHPRSARRGDLFPGARARRRAGDRGRAAPYLARILAALPRHEILRLVKVAMAGRGARARAGLRRRVRDLDARAGTPTDLSGTRWLAPCKQPSDLGTSSAAATTPASGSSSAAPRTSTTPSSRASTVYEDLHYADWQRIPGQLARRRTVRCVAVQQLYLTSARRRRASCPGIRCHRRSEILVDPVDARDDGVVLVRGAAEDDPLAGVVAAAEEVAQIAWLLAGASQRVPERSVGVPGSSVEIPNTAFAARAEPEHHGQPWQALHQPEDLMSEGAARIRASRAPRRPRSPARRPRSRTWK